MRISQIGISKGMTDCLNKKTHKISLSLNGKQQNFQNRWNIKMKEIIREMCIQDEGMFSFLSED